MSSFSKRIPKSSCTCRLFILNVVSSISIMQYIINIKNYLIPMGVKISYKQFQVALLGIIDLIFR